VGLSLQQLAAFSGMDAQALIALENGTLHQPASDEFMACGIQ